MTENIYESPKTSDNEEAGATGLASTPEPKTPGMQFSISTLMVTVLVVAVGCMGWKLGELVSQRHQWRDVWIWIILLLSMLALILLMVLGKKAVTVFSLMGLMANASLIVAKTGFYLSDPMLVPLLAFVSTPGAFFLGSLRFSFVRSATLPTRMAFLLPSVFVIGSYASALYYA